MTRSTPETNPLEAEAACLPTTDTILLDGANSVCGAPRARFPGAGWDLAAAFVAAAAFALAFRRRAWGAAGLLALLAAGPGLWAVAVLRADAPATREAAARDVHAALRELVAPGESPRAPVYLTRNDDGPYAPLFFYAHPVHHQAPDRVPQADRPIAVHGGLLRAGCMRDPLTNGLVCGEERRK